MYSTKTIKKVVKAVRDMFDEFVEMIRRGDVLNVSISRGNRKIGRVLNVSISPIATCGNCSHCAPYCYDVKAVLLYKNVLKARAKNTAMAMECRDEYFSQINAAMDRRRDNKYMRYHVGGEIPDADYLDRMIDSARRHPDFIVWTYTKMHALVNAYVRSHGGTRAAAIPSNMVIMFSEWDGMPLLNPYGFPVFTVKMAAGNINHSAEYFDGLYKCPGNCDVCKAARRGCLAGETTYADEH